MASKQLNCSLACPTQVVLENETRCLNVKLLIFLALHKNTKLPWNQNVGGANVFQEEKEMEKEKEMEIEKEMETEKGTSSPDKWRMSRDSPEQGITRSSPECGESVIA